MQSSTRTRLAMSVAALVTTLPLCGCWVNLGDPPVIGSGIAKTETRTIQDFNEIDVGGAMQLDVAVGPATSLEITTDDNVLPHVKTNVVGKPGQAEQRLSINTGNGNISTKIGIRVKVTTPNLKVFTGAGATTVNLTGMNADEFKLGLSGASDCTLAGKAGELDVSVDGASRCKLKGDARTVNLNCSGASRLNSIDLNAETVTATVSGASKAELNAKEELTVKASGASTVHYTGEPAKLKRETSGASTISQRKPEAEASKP